MILPDFFLKSRADQCWLYSGIDSPDACLDKVHFMNYPHDVSYQYNSRGFRDKEWPDSLQELKTAIWCLGDSFTVGIGSPVRHTWVYQLEQAAGRRTLNVSMDGASNYWIARKTLEVIKNVSPETIIIHWSFIHRGERDDQSLSDEDRRLHFATDYHGDVKFCQNFIELVKKVETAKQHTRVIHSFIPNFGFQQSQSMLQTWNRIAGENWPPMPGTWQEFVDLPDFVVDELKNSFKLYLNFEMFFQLYHNIDYVSELEIIDLARDGFHYDIKTSQRFVGDLMRLLNC